MVRRPSSLPLKFLPLLLLAKPCRDNVSKVAPNVADCDLSRHVHIIGRILISEPASDLYSPPMLPFVMNLCDRRLEVLDVTIKERNPAELGAGLCKEECWG